MATLVKTPAGTWKALKPFKWNKTAETIISPVHKAKLGAIKNRF